MVQCQLCLLPPPLQPIARRIAKMKTLSANR